MSLYDELGVPPDADADQIKRAHRKMAKENHPDAGGDAETFQRKQRAYMILSDPKKRERYDKVGEEEAEPRNEMMEATAAVMAAFDQAVLAAGQNFRRIDLVEATRRNLKSERAAFERSKQDAIKSKEGLGMLLERISRKRPGADVLRISLRERQDMLDERVRTLELADAVIERALRLVGDYLYRVDPPDPVPEADAARAESHRVRGEFKWTTE